MHPCLSITEIFSLILENLDSEPNQENQEGFTKCKGLQSLARTCRSLSEPTLDVIWRKLPSFVPLIKALPPDLWEVREEAETGVWNVRYDEDGKETELPVHVFRLHRAPVDGEWNRLLQYSHRVRVLTIRSTYDHGIVDAEGFRILTRMYPGELLPNLCWISLSLGVPYIIQAIPLCSQHFRERITTVTTAIELFPNHFSTACRAVLQHCPNIKALSFYGPEELGEDVKWRSLARMICRYDALESVYLDEDASSALDYTPRKHRSDRTGTHSLALAHLSSLTTLVSLQINCQSVPPATLARFLSNEDECFLSLSRLELRDLDNYGQAVSILSSFSSPRAPKKPLSDLKTLLITVHTTHAGFSPDFAHLLELLSRPRFTAGLRVLDILIEHKPRLWGLGGDKPRTPGEIDNLAQDAFRHLFPLHHLRSLTYRGPLCDRLDNAWFTTAAKSWPHIQELLIRPQHFESKHPRATLEALIPFVRHCLNIWSFNIPMIWRPFDIQHLTENFSTNMIRNTHILHVSSYDAAEEIERPGEVLACLTALFPNLEEILGLGDHQTDGWKELECLADDALAGQDSLYYIRRIFT